MAFLNISFLNGTPPYNLVARAAAAGRAVAARDALFAVVTAVGRLWWQPRASPGCVVLGVALHYSLLAAAAWTTAAAALQLLRLGTVAGAQARVPHVVLVCSTCSWLLPLVPVAALMVVLGLRAGYPLRQDSASDFLCYPQGAAFYVSVLLPATVCILINAAIFLYLLFTVLFPLCRGGSGVVVTRHGPSQLRHRSLTMVMLFFLLGLPWLLGPPAREPAVAYIFSIVATPQGLMLFIFFVLCNDKLRRRLNSTLLSTLPTSSSPLRHTMRKQKTETPGGADMSLHTLSSGVPASADGSVRSRRRQLEFPLQERPLVLLTRYTVLGEEGQVRYTFDLSSWSPDDGNPFDAAYMPTSQDRRSATKYVFPQTQMDQEGENSN
ncbi:adhesion G-protein coupled receptor G6-like [Schistocerca serialis cubense]|uniref:adhesion G-protein coupled receptor G6-like n=1 Tax=Schistocerca serialis cubense TaxID=2023355 RepID=UPI00214E2BE7|nr:adhesion G-protein coupled receptor G6-like [Schistocerca serialis cubense]